MVTPGAAGGLVLETRATSRGYVIAQKRARVAQWVYGRFALA
jgi:hypothetical protein